MTPRMKGLTVDHFLSQHSLPISCSFLPLFQCLSLIMLYHSCETHNRALVVSGEGGIDLPTKGTELD